MKIKRKIIKEEEIEVPEDSHLAKCCKCLNDMKCTYSVNSEEDEEIIIIITRAGGKDTKIFHKFSKETFELVDIKIY